MLLLHFLKVKLVLFRIDCLKINCHFKTCNNNIKGTRIKNNSLGKIALHFYLIGISFLLIEKKSEILLFTNVN